MLIFFFINLVELKLLYLKTKQNIFVLYFRMEGVKSSYAGLLGRVNALAI